MDIGVKRRLYGPNKWPLTPVCKDTWQNLQPILLFLPTQSCLLSASRYPREHEHLYPCAEKSHCCSHLKLSRRQPSTPAKEVLNHSYCLLWHRTVTNNSTDIQLVQFVYKNKTFRQSRSGHSHVQLSITYQNANSWQAAFSTTVTDKLFHFYILLFYFCPRVLLVSWDFERCSVCRKLHSATCHECKSTNFHFAPERFDIWLVPSLLRSVFTAQREALGTMMDTSSSWIVNQQYGAIHHIVGYIFAEDWVKASYDWMTTK